MGTFYFVGYVMFLPYHIRSHAVWRFMLWHACTIMAIKLFWIELNWNHKSELIITLTSLWPRWRLTSPASRLFTQPFIQTQIKENIKAPRHWPLCVKNSPGPVNSPHKGPVTRKMFPFDDVIMWHWSSKTASGKTHSFYQFSVMLDQNTPLGLNCTWDEIKVK